MKQVKIVPLFFLVIFFLSCKEEVLKNDGLPNQKTQEEKFVPVDFSQFKNLNNKEQLQLSKKILNKRAINSSDKYRLFNLNRFLYSKLNEPDSAIGACKKMLNLEITKESDAYLGHVNFRLGLYFNQINLRDSAFYYYNIAKKHFFKTKDSLQLGASFLNIAYIESNFGDYTKSDSSAVASIKFINGKKATTTASAYNILAINSKQRSIYQDAVNYYKKGIAITTRKSSKIIYKNNLANVYKEFKDYSKAILILENLLKDSIVNLKTKARVIDNLAYIKWLNNANEPVEKDLLFAKSIRIQEKDTYGLAASYTHLSDFFKEKDTEKALLYAMKMYDATKELVNPKGQIEAIEKITALVTPLKAIKYYEESIRLSDSLQKVETNRQYKFAKIKYDYEEEEKKKLKFKTLATENKLIAEQENNQKKNILIITVILASSLLFLLYRRKQQHKKQVLQEKYNTETRIAKKLHDELGNDIFKILTKVQASTYKPTDIINDLDKIYLQTRAISHENDTIETGGDFENHFRELVASYNSDTCKIILKDLASIELNKLDKEKQIVIYRVFNEFFVNMKKHSEATLVVVACKRIKNEYQIIYSDNGVGFKENKIIYKNGLKNTKIRIKNMNGTLNFENNPIRGIKIIFNFKN
ncbi:hypothetical protein K8354_00850 [Polaribacter litorisediminis]|uniref:sensor histidine kinase n=1 Tax=Polaribacter litorisediminis TaxID=1908341 RepID=UPI001CBF00D1|nr:hypothetical protein [Polaribacter litorisediminis]UAM98408.1 hypothetical protein K8354_00850 [Polaribacter litorisediminis]